MNIFHTVSELWPGHRLLYATKTREDNSKAKNARVVFLVNDTSYKCVHALVKFHEYIPYGLGVMAHTRLTLCNLDKGK